MLDGGNDLLERLASLRRWSRDGKRAPHKPLLLLLALARIQRGEDRLIGFKDIELPLNNLIRDFSPSRKTSAHYPFWHLQTDGLWVIEDGARLAPKKGGSSPTVSLLRENLAEGGLPPPFFEALKKDPSLVSLAVRTVLDAHFPTSLHEELAARTGVSVDADGPTTSSKRDPRFRDDVLLAYNWACAVCGFTSHLGGAPFGLEAAHVRWHSHQGPSTVNNGLCLCSIHHKALDRGVISISATLEVLVSPRLQENDHTSRAFYAFAGHTLVPRKGYPSIKDEFADWHRKNCFLEV